MPLPTPPESGEGRRAWRWTKDGRRQGAKHSSFPVSVPLLRAVHLPLGKHDIFACRESRLFRKRGRTHLVPAQRSEHQPMTEVGGLQRLPLLSRPGGHCPPSCRCGTTRMPAITSSPPPAAVQLYAFGGWALRWSGWSCGKPALLSGSLDVVQLGCGSPTTWAVHIRGLCRLCPELGLLAEVTVGADIGVLAHLREPMCLAALLPPCRGGHAPLYAPASYKATRPRGCGLLSVSRNFIVERRGNG